MPLTGQLAQLSAVLENTRPSSLPQPVHYFFHPLYPGINRVKLLTLKSVQVPKLRSDQLLHEAHAEAATATSSGLTTTITPGFHERQRSPRGTPCRSPLGSSFKERSKVAKARKQPRGYPRSVDGLLA